MKKTSSLFLLSLTLSLAACQNMGKDKAPKFPKPGTVVATAEMPVTEDTLNKFTFGIKVIADSAITDGVYDVAANYEYHTSEGQFTMPKGGEDLKPIIRKGKEPYTYIIGFKVAGDTTFHDYFQVSATDIQMTMRYIMQYTF